MSGRSLGWSEMSRWTALTNASCAASSRVAREAQRLADGVAKPLVRNALERQDRGAAVLGQALEQGLAVGAFDRLARAVGDGADQVEIVRADGQKNADVLVAVRKREQERAKGAASASGVWVSSSSNWSTISSVAVFFAGRSHCSAKAVSLGSSSAIRLRKPARSSSR